MVINHLLTGMILQVVVRVAVVVHSTPRKSNELIPKIAIFKGSRYLKKYFFVSMFYLFRLGAFSGEPAVSFPECTWRMGSQWMEVINNNGDRKSPNWGCGTPSKWPFYGL